MFLNEIVQVNMPELLSKLLLPVLLSSYFIVVIDVTDFIGVLFCPQQHFTCKDGGNWKSIEEIVFKR